MAFNLHNLRGPPKSDALAEHEGLTLPKCIRFRSVCFMFSSFFDLKRNSTDDASPPLAHLNIGWFATNKDVAATVF